MNNLQTAVEVKKVVESLSKGVNPFTGEKERGGALSDERVQKALSVAAKMLEDAEKREKALSDSDASTNERRKWTALEEMQLQEEAKQGFTVEQMADAHKRSWAGIISRLSKMGLLVENDPSGGKRWQKEEEERLREEFSDGMLLEQMAASHGRSMQGIIGRLAKMGLIEN